MGVNALQTLGVLRFLHLIIIIIIIIIINVNLYSALSFEEPLMRISSPSLFPLSFPSPFNPARGSGRAL